MADVKFEVVSADIPANRVVGHTIDLDISGFGTPKAVMLFYTRGSADGVVGSWGNHSVSIWDGTSSFMVFNQINDGSASQTIKRYQSTTKALIDTLGSSTVNRSFAFTDFHTDGVRITCNINDTTGVPAGKVTAILIGGADVTNAVVKNTYNWGSAGTNTFTGVGFESDLLFPLTNCVAGFNGFSSFSVTAFGVAVNDGLQTQRCISRTADVGNTTGRPRSVVSNNRIYHQLSASSDTTIDHQAALASFTTDGFTTTQTGNGGTDDFGVLCLKFQNDPDIALFDTSVPTTGNIAEDGIGFQPDFGLLHFEEGPTSRNTMNRWGCSAPWHIFDSNSVHTQNITNEDLATTMVAKGVWYDSFTALDPDGSSTLYAGTGPVFDSAGWDITLTTNPGKEILGWGLAVGSGGGGGSTPVNSDATLQWSILHTVQQDSSMQWSILNAVLQDSDLRWSLLNSIQNDSALQWSILQAINQDSDIRWNIQAALSAVVSDSDLRWSVLNAVEQDAQVNWSILQAAMNDTDLRWSILTAVLQDADVRWSVINAIFSDADMRWSSLAAVLQDADVRWDIAAPAGTVSSSLDIRWNILSVVYQSLTTQWDILNSITQDSDIRWQILNAISNDSDLRWAILQSAENDASLQWSIISTTERDITLRWSIEGESVFPDLTGVIALSSKTPVFSVESLTPKITIH